MAFEPNAEELRLLKSIAAAPEDESPRLVYADWLMEHGQAERGELIALHCQALKLPWGPRKDTLLSKVHALQRRVPKPRARRPPPRG